MEALAGVGLLAGVEAMVGHLLFRRALARRPAASATRRLARYPSVTVIRPVRGRDADAELNFAAALDMDYPGEVETLFLFDDATDPGLPLARAAVDAHRATGRPGTADVQVVGAPPPGWTGKLHAMRRGVQRAKGELIAFGDSDTRPDREVLRVTVETLLNTERAGCAFAPIVARVQAPTAGDTGYALLINSWYQPLVARAADAEGRMPMMMGQLMVFTREALQAIGGIECARGQLIDDMYLGLRLIDAGYHNVVAPSRLPVAVGGLSLREFAQTFRRWLIFSRAGLPMRFTAPMWLRGAGIGAALVALVVGAVSGSAWALATAGAALGLYCASVWRLAALYSGQRLPLRHAWMALSVPLLGGWGFLSGILRPNVSWRGRSYALSRSAQLAR